MSKEKRGNGKKVRESVALQNKTDAIFVELSRKPHIFVELSRKPHVFRKSTFDIFGIGTHERGTDYS